MTKLVVIFGFLLAFAAGLIVGVNRHQQIAISPTAGPSTRQSRESELDTLLNLRPEQKAELKKIWSETADSGRKQHEERRRDLRHQRDEKLEALLSADQKASFAKIHEEYEQQTEAIEREMRGNFQKSVERTKEVLDTDQRVKYEEWLRKRQWDRGPRGPRQNRDTTRRSDAGAASTSPNQP